jgi:outer membrane receptor protein involved in Fe transport
MKYITTLVLFLLLCTRLWAHEGQLQGRVLDAATRLPLGGATIRIQDSPLGAIANEAGGFRFSQLSLGICLIRVSFLGYRDTTLSVQLIAHQTTDVTVALQPAALQLADVPIRASEGAPVAAVSGLDLHLRPIGSAQDMLRSVPGLFIAQHAGGGKAEQIFLRGFDIDHGTDVRISADGLPVNMVSHAHGQGYADLHFLIPETVGQLEFGKGPYYARQGNLATAGFVNFRTANTLDHSLVKLESGAFNTWRGLAMVKLTDQRLEEKGQHIYVAAEQLFSKGYFENDQDFRRTNTMLKYHGRLSNTHFLNASASYFRSGWNASGQIPVRAIESGQIGPFGAIDPNEGGHTGRYQAQAELVSSLPNGVQIRNQVFAIHYDFELFSNFTFFLEDSVNGDQIRQRENRDIVGYNFSVGKDASLFEMPLHHAAGVSVRADFVDDISLAHTLNRETVLNPLARGDVRELNASAWVEEHLHLSARARLDAGLRYDQFRFQYNDALQPQLGPRAVWQGRISPKLNLNYQLTEQLLAFVQSGIGFHSNDSRVVVAQNGLQTLPRATGAETGLMYKLKDQLLVNASVWWLDLQQEFVYVGDAGVVEPSGRSVRTGVDVGVRWQPVRWLFVDADFNVARPRGESEDGQLDSYIPLAPLHTSIGGVTVLHKGFSGSLRYRFLGDRPANEDNSLNAEGYLLFNTVLQYETRRFLFGGSVDNILNTLWREAQFETESRLQGEAEPVTEIHFTPGTPRAWKLWVGFKF